MREITMLNMPAVALVGPDGRIVRSTETFRRRSGGAEKLCESSPELEQVLTSRSDVATVSVAELSVVIQAVTDASGRRQALLALPPLDPAPTPEPPLSALRDAADESPGLVWVKDLEGRYLYANPRYTEELGTSEERLHGKTDAELPETETVDGPRRRCAEDGSEEPLHLEYTVPAIDPRPALAVSRFALRDKGGQPIATCGVAAPTVEAQVARDEAVHLMQIERWNRLDPIDVRAELLEQWHVRPAESVSRPIEVPAAPRPAPPPTPTDTAELLQTDLRMARRWADRTDELQAELEQARLAAARAAEEADRWRSELEQTRLELSAARAQVEALRGPSAAVLRLSDELRPLALSAEQERADELERTLARLRSRLTDFETALDDEAGAPARTS